MPLKKEAVSYFIVGVVDFELWVMLISLGQYEQAPTNTLDRELHVIGGNSGTIHSFRSGYGIPTRTQQLGTSSYAGGSGFKPVQCLCRCVYRKTN